MTRQEIHQQVEAKKQCILAAIKRGTNNRADIVRVTGLKRNLINSYLREMFVDHNVPNFDWLKKVMGPPSKPMPSFPRFTSHDCVIVDKALRPSLAADMLVQVLGKDYCSKLIDALMVACVPTSSEDC